MTKIEFESDFDSPAQAQKNTCNFPGSGAEMVFVPSQSFDMGSDHGAPAEGPVHRVTLDAFWVDVQLVTNARYARFVDATGYRTHAEREGCAWGFLNGRFDMVSGLSWRHYASTSRAEHPVVLVTWNDAIAYCEWADVRLLTEAEWEYCARGGRRGQEFPWGSDVPDGSQSNFARPPSELPPTLPVGEKGCNTLGIADLVGNVWQWCSDWFDEGYYHSSLPINPAGPISGRLKVRRGGSWNVIQGFRLRCSNRGAMDPGKAAPNVGFRTAISATKLAKPQS
jgi:sulfatase modifying factor 1